MAAEHRSQEFRLENVDKTRSYLFEEINWNGLISKKHKNVCATLNYIEHFLFLGAAITGCISISAFASLVGVSIGIASSTVGLKICPITAAIKIYKSIIKKKKKNPNKIAFLPKSNLNSIEVLIPKASIYSFISHDNLF